MGPRLPITTAFRLILAGAALLLLGACATVPEPQTGAGQKVGSAQILSICEKLSRSNDTRLAIGLCEKAHMEDPENPVPLLLLADMLQQKGALAEAGRAYGMAIDLDPDNVEAHYGLGKVFLARNQFELAIEQFEIARELNSRDHRLYNAIGVVLDNLGDHVGAQQHYQTGLELAPDNHALLRNLMLSRRLDDSVTTPAIGPRHKVVPAPVSEPGIAPGQSAPAAAPGTDPTGIPSTQPRPGSGRLKHEPLAQVPGRATSANDRSAQQLAANELPAPPEASAIAVTRVIETRAPAADSYRRAARPETPTGMPSKSDANADSTVRPIASDDGALAYYPIVLPSREAAATSLKDRVQTASLEPFTYSIDSLVESVWTTSASQDVEAATLVSEQNVPANITAETSTLESTEPAAVASAIAVSDSGNFADRGPEIIATAIAVRTIEQEELVAMEAAPPRRRAIAYPSAGAPGKQTEQVSSVPGRALDTELFSKDRAASESLMADRARNQVRAAGVPTEKAGPVTSLIAPSLAAYSPTASTTSDLPPATGPSVFTSSGDGFTDKPLTLVSSRTNDMAAESRAAAVSDGTQQHRAKPQARSLRRFGREHEENHETRQVEGEFWDLVDVVNPLQHLPVVASIYRDVTEDEIKPAARIAGGTLFGGVLGFATSLVDSVIEEASGRDVGETTIAVLRSNSSNGGSDDTDRMEIAQRAPADTPHVRSKSFPPAGIALRTGS